ncbi:hypothetical protein [Deinococcus peraridilitoris]|uniref:Uncharacterized protein n=1 Tax=Deinococcus peraridilitoris (strain DSM 19664 / LMG 22246 / CIP 109416 / KR-200) TaxID=937777 RepID=L0A7U7_DEIPD|nr:hypothetical protein [Deinococcus peraridilitoris]AFZ69257.1 hypothetical protein Deipe_3835 [Deinococcus peraridilitoris DSM 19664]
MFEELFGNSGRNERFARAQNNHNDVDPHEAAEYVGQFMQQAPPETQQQVLQQYIAQLDPRQRQALAQAMIQHNGTPVQNVRDDDDDDMIQAFQRSGQSLTGQQGNRPGQGLGELFGMFGGMMGGAGAQQGGFGQQQSPMGGFGQPQQGASGGLGQLLENPMARAGLVSLAAMIGSKMMNRR